MSNFAGSASAMFAQIATARYITCHIKRSCGQPQRTQKLRNKQKKARTKRKKEKRKNRTKLQESKKPNGGKNIEPLSRDKNSTDKSNVQSSVDPQEQNMKSEKISGNKGFDSPARSICSDDDIEEDEKDADKNQAPIDFSLYLQQTGSIIALARLMDALDEGGFTEDFDQKSLLRNQ